MRVETGNINTNDEATVGSEVKITVNDAVTASPASDERLYIAISILDKDAWIRFMPAVTETSERKGIFMKKNTTYEMPTDNVYTGEISIINKKNNEKPKFHVTEF